MKRAFPLLPFTPKQFSFFRCLAAQKSVGIFIYNIANQQWTDHLQLNLGFYFW